MNGLVENKLLNYEKIILLKNYFNEEDKLNLLKMLNNRKKELSINMNANIKMISNSKQRAINNNNRKKIKYTSKKIIQAIEIENESIEVMIEKVKNDILELCKGFPLYPGMEVLR